MRILVLGGAGAMASGTVRDLVASPFSAMTELVIADSAADKANALAASVNDARVRAVSVDVSDVSSLDEALKAFDLCINAVPTFAGFQMAIFDACFNAGVDYVDYGGMGVYTVMQKKQADKWRDAGLTAVLGLGADPGISNIVCKAVAERLDTIDSINLYWAAARLGPENPILVPPYALSTLLAEYANKSQQFLGGRLQEMPPRSGHETLMLPEPWGATEFIYTQHSEPLTIPFAADIKAKGIQEFTWKLHLPPAEHAAWESFVKAGFGNFDEPISINGASITPVAFLDAVIQRNLTRHQAAIPATESHELRFAIGRGTKDGKPHVTNQAVIVRPHPLYDGYGDAATSMGLSVGVQLLVRQDKKPGVWGPEEYYDVAPFFAELERRHFSVVADLAVKPVESIPSH